MTLFSSLQFEYLIRILIAGLCGGIIGYERENRMKEAGIRTHFIVCLSAALMMIVSKYGFQDQIGTNDISLDPSRIAAQVVSGVGFLGAGMIFMKRQSIKGLTTAAGIWATAGIGLAFGAGLYIIGLTSSAIIVIAQTILHRNFSWLSIPRIEGLTLKISNEPEVLEYIEEILKKESIKIMNFKAKRGKPDNVANKSKLIELELILKVPQTYDAPKLLSLMEKNSNIRYLEI